MAFSTVDNMTIYEVRLLLRMPVHSRTHPRPLAHAGLWLFGWVARSEGVQTIASLGAIGPIRRLVALLGPVFAAGARTRADRPHACMRPSRPSCSFLARLSGATGDRASSSTLDSFGQKQQQDVPLQRLNSKLDLQQSSTVAYDAPRKAHISKFASQRSYAEM